MDLIDESSVGTSTEETVGEEDRAGRGLGLGVLTNWRLRHNR